MDDGMGDQIKARLFREEIAKRVRTLANEGKIDWSDHAFDRMEERGIDSLTAERVLKRGDLKGDPKPGEQKDEWVVTVVDRVTRTRDVGVVTVVIGTKSLRVATVEWEDL